MPAFYQGIEDRDLHHSVGHYLPITVCHFPPGTSKWNKIEHRLFSHITMNWRGKPLVSHEAMVQLIANTTTKTGLKVKAALDTGSYPKGRSVSKREMKDLNRQMIGPHEGWAYTISPRPQNRVS